MLYRVIAKKFVAGYSTQNGIVVECAPILRKWIMGKTWSEALNVLRNCRVEFLS